MNGKPEPSGKRAETCLARHAYYAAYTIVPHVSVPGTPRRDMNEEMGVTDSCTVNSKSRPGHMYCLDCDPRVCTMRVQTKTRGAYSVQYLELASPSIFAEGGHRQTSPSFGRQMPKTACDVRTESGRAEVNQRKDCDETFSAIPCSWADPP